MLDWLNGRLKVKYRHPYEILWSKRIDGDKDYHGTTTEDPRQVILKLNESAAKTFWSAFHEILHAISYAYKLNLTEKQVEGIELGFRYIFKRNKKFRLEPPKE